MSETLLDNTLIPVARDTLLKMCNTAKQKQASIADKYSDEKDAYLADMFRQLERLPSTLTGDIIWANSRDDGSILITLAPSVEKPRPLMDWEHLEQMWGVDTRTVIPVAPRLVALLISYNKENTHE